LILNFLRDLFFKINFFKIKLIIFSILFKNKGFDYGAGYFYQSSDLLGIRGLRESIYRIKKLNLNDIIKNKDILDIGTNTGFILLDLKQDFKSATGIEINPTYVKIANFLKRKLNKKKLNFVNKDFTKINLKKDSYDCILSLANHCTYDGNIRNTSLYFKKINYILKKKGLLILESQHPNIERKNKFTKIVNSIIETYNYKIISRGIYKSKNFYENNRSFVIFRK